MTRPVPMVDDVALDAVTWAHQTSRQRFSSVPVAGLDGDVQQGLGRGSHEIELRGVLVGDGAPDALARLQKRAADGSEAVFHADIATALDIKKVVLVRAEFVETAGRPGRWDYYLLLRESPPLPPPAELSPFGGLDGFDLGFDTSVLGDIADIADKVQSAVEAVSSAISDLQQLASLADLNLGNPIEPIQSEAAKLGAVGGAAASAVSALTSLLGGG